MYWEVIDQLVIQDTASHILECLKSIGLNSVNSRTDVIMVRICLILSPEFKVDERARKLHSARLIIYGDVVKSLGESRIHMVTGTYNGLG